MSHDLVMDTAPLPPQLDRSSQDFLEVVRTGDRARLDALLARHIGAAHAQARRLLGSADDADDAVQEAVLRLLRTAWRYDARVPFAAWFAQLVHVAAVRERRTAVRRHQREAIAGAAPVPTSTASEEALQERVRLALARIPRRDQEALDLHYISGLDQSACAAALGTSLSAMSSRITRARERLRAQLSASGTPCAMATITQALAAPHAAASAPLADAMRAAIDGGALVRRASWGARLLHAVRALTGGGATMTGITAAILVLVGLVALAHEQLSTPTPEASEVHNVAVRAPDAAAAADAAPPAPRSWQGPARALLWDIQPHDELTAGIEIDALRDHLLASRLATDPDLSSTWARLRTLLQTIGEDSPDRWLTMCNDLHGLALSIQARASAQAALLQRPDIGVFADLGTEGPPTHRRLDQGLGGSLTRCGPYDAYALPSFVIAVHGPTLAIASLDRLAAASAREQAQPPLPPEWMRDPLWLDCDLHALPMLEAAGDGRELIPAAWYGTGAASLHLSATPTSDGFQGTLAISGVTMPLAPLDRRYAGLVDEHGVASLAVHADLPKLLAAGLDQLAAPLCAPCGLTPAQLGQRLDGQLAVRVASTSPWAGTIALGIVPGQELAEPLGRLMQVLGGAPAGQLRWSIGSPLGTLTVALTQRDLLISNAPDLDQVARRLDQGASGTASEALVAQADTGAWARAGLAALARYLQGRRIVASPGFMSYPMQVLRDTAEIQVMEGRLDELRGMTTLQETSFPRQSQAPRTSMPPQEAPPSLGASDFTHSHIEELCSHALILAAASVPGHGSRCLTAVRVREGFAVSEVAVDANGRWQHGNGLIDILDADALNRRIVTEGLEVVHGDIAHATAVAGMPALALFDASDLPDADALARSLPRYRTRVERQGDRLTITEDGLPLLAVLPLARCLMGLPAAMANRQEGPHVWQLPPGTTVPEPAAPNPQF